MLRAGLRSVQQISRALSTQTSEYGATPAGGLRSEGGGGEGVTADLDTPAPALDIFALDDNEDDAVAAAAVVLGLGAAMIDGSAALGRRRNVFRIQDELWRALRGAPGLVESSDRVTRLGRHRREVSAQFTHSLDDLEALPTAEDRAKARGMAPATASSRSVLWPTRNSTPSATSPGSPTRRPTWSAPGARPHLDFRSSAPRSW
jgi:hypothetical protein